MARICAAIAVGAVLGIVALAVGDFIASQCFDRRIYR